MVHSPDGFEQTPSKAKDEMSHVGAILLGGTRRAWTHGISKTEDKKMERRREKKNYVISFCVLLKVGATM